MRCYKQTDLRFDGCLKISYHIHVSYEKQNSFVVIKIDVIRTSSFAQNHVHTLKEKQYLWAQNAKIEVLFNTYIKGYKHTDRDDGSKS
jgi:hypothetical protein